MAGMLYLPRLFVYHADAEKGSVQSETFKVMERRLLRGIINPAMTLSWVFGLWLAWRDSVSKAAGCMQNLPPCLFCQACMAICRSRFALLRRIVTKSLRGIGVLSMRRPRF
jgi:uncharacterized membrane protein